MMIQLRLAISQGELEEDPTELAFKADCTPEQWDTFCQEYPDLSEMAELVRVFTLRDPVKTANGDLDAHIRSPSLATAGEAGR